MPRLLGSLSFVRPAGRDEVASAGDERHNSQALRRTSRRRTALLAALALLCAATRVRRVVVDGPSMEPTLHHGDRLVVWRTHSLRCGDIVVFSDPARPDRLLVKRALRIGAGGLHVEGDNPDESRDSREFGPVPLDRVLGIAVYRYLPTSDEGRLRRPAPGAHLRLE